MRSLPTTIRTFKSIRVDKNEDLNRIQDAIGATLQDLAGIALIVVRRVTGTGNPQAVNLGVKFGTWTVGAPSAFLQWREVSRAETVLTLQATAGVSFDVIAYL